VRNRDILKIFTIEIYFFLIIHIIKIKISGQEAINSNLLLESKRLTKIIFEI